MKRGIALVLCTLVAGIIAIILVQKSNLTIQAKNDRAVVESDRVSARSAPAKKTIRNVAILVYQDMEILDFAGPAEVFAAAGQGEAFNVYTVAASSEPIISQGFVTITPQYSLENCPTPEIIVLPGGRSSIPSSNEKVVEWVKHCAAHNEVTLSVCTGAFILAKAGLLDGKDATTHWGSIERLKETATKTKVLENCRFVDSGKVITAAGVSAGIDGALHVVDRLLGEQTAQQTARYMEYNWKRDLNK